MDAMLLVGLFGLTCFVVIEALFRRRTEKYLAQRVSEIAQQLGVVARTNEIMSDQVNYLSNINVNNRLEDVESDISVLGTVVRELAEAVAEVEELQATQAMAAPAASAPEPKQETVYNVSPLKPLIGAKITRKQNSRTCRFPFFKMRLSRGVSGSICNPS